MTRRAADTRVVITAFGLCSHYGFSPDAFKNVVAPPAAPVLRVAAEGLADELDRYIPAKDRRRFNRLTKIGALAALACVRNSGLRVPEERRDDYGAIFGCGFGPVASSRDFVRSGLEAGLQAASPLIFPYTVGNATPGVITMMLGWRGISSTVSGYNPIGYALDAFVFGRATGVLVGGMEELTDEMADAFSHRRDAAGRELAPLRPLTEGAAMLLLETLDSARERGATPLLELLGSGLAASLANGERSFDHLGEIDPAAVAHAMRQALDDAGVEPEQVGTLVSLARADSGQVEAERSAFESLGGRAEAVQTLYPKQVLGESFGAGECFAVLYAYQHARSDEARPYTVVNGHQVGGALSSLVLRRPAQPAAS